MDSNFGEMQLDRTLELVRRSRGHKKAGAHQSWDY